MSWRCCWYAWRRLPEALDFLITRRQTEALPTA